MGSTSDLHLIIIDGDELELKDCCEGDDEVVCMDEVNKGAQPSVTTNTTGKSRNLQPPRNSSGRNSAEKMHSVRGVSLQKSSSHRSLDMTLNGRKSSDRIFQSKRKPSFGGGQQSSAKKPYNTNNDVQLKTQMMTANLQQTRRQNTSISRMNQNQPRKPILPPSTDHHTSKRPQISYDDGVFNIPTVVSGHNLPPTQLANFYSPYAKGAFPSSNGGIPSLASVPVSPPSPTSNATMQAWQRHDMLNTSNPMGNFGGIHGREAQVQVGNFQQTNADHCHFGNENSARFPSVRPRPVFGADQNYVNTSGMNMNYPPQQFGRNVEVTPYNATPSGPRANNETEKPLTLHELISKLPPPKIEPSNIEVGSQLQPKQLPPSVKLETIRGTALSVDPPRPSTSNDLTDLSARASEVNDATEMEVSHSDADGLTLGMVAGKLDHRPVFLEPSLPVLSVSRMDASFRDSTVTVDSGIHHETTGIHETTSGTVENNSGSVAKNVDDNARGLSEPPDVDDETLAKEPGEISDDDDTSTRIGKKLTLEKLKEIHQRVEDMEKNDRKTNDFLLSLCVDLLIDLETSTIVARIYEEKDVVNVANKKNREKIIKMNKTLEEFKFCYDKKKADLAVAEKAKEEAIELKGQNEALCADVREKAATIEDLQRRLLKSETDLTEVLEKQRNHGQSIQTTRAERDQAIRERDEIELRLYKAELYERQAKTEMKELVSGYTEAVKKAAELKRAVDEHNKISEERDSAKSRNLHLEMELSNRDVKLKATTEAFEQSEKKLENSEKEKETLLARIEKNEEDYMRILQKIKGQGFSEKQKSSLRGLHKRTKEVIEKKRELDQAVEGTKSRRSSCQPSLTSTSNK